MSSSALIAAKKRLETCLKKFEIPTVETIDFEETEDSGVLLLSLLQSRLQWTSSVFTKYKADPVQQPKRVSNTRKKWPYMKYLGTGTLELGPHIFSNTSFYKANRSISWINIAKQQGLDVSDINVNEGDPSLLLEFDDIVFELSEIPNERYIFPKDALISLSVEDGPIVLHASFVLPLDSTDGFSETPKNQILKWGKSCPLPIIQNFKDEEELKPEDTTIYQPVNIRISLLNQTTIDAIEDHVNKPDQVKESMMIKMKSFPKKRFVKFDLSQDPTSYNEVKDLLKRALTVPDITTGPIMAEKKRNEILNAIRLGKRPRDEKFEAELPKNKYTNTVAKEDGLLKCAYCSTRHTAMWRPGPGGHGTLCNSCGIQWKQGEILKGAPVISPEEEKRIIKEKKEREKLAEIIELEKESKKYQKKVEKEVDLSKKSTSLPISNNKRQTKSITNNIPNQEQNNNINNNDEDKKKTILKSKNEKTIEVSENEVSATVVQPIETTINTNTNVNTQPTQSQQQQNNSFFLYSQGGIPLPTLSIDFGGTILFSHPNCAVTLLDGHFHVRLCTETGEQSVINLEKTDLVDAEFNISQEGEINAKREVLTMTISPLKKPIQILNQLLNLEHTIKIRFLEKLDPSGGAVVKRILQRWLVTAEDHSKTSDTSQK